MDVRIISICNSKAINLPNASIEKYQIADTVELILENEYIVVKPKREPRKEWGKAFKEMHENGDDHLLIPDVFENENLGK